MTRRFEEDDIQKALVSVVKRDHSLRALAGTIYAVPNGGARRRVEAARLKGLGVRPGVSDLVVPEPVLVRPLEPGECLGLYLELKSRTGSATPAQREWRDLMRARGYRAEIVRGYDDALAVLRDHAANVARRVT